jgi:alpha-methylacyl-CoA racemase
VIGTLTSIRIINTAVNVPGPVAARTLRDMGATVVKVEPAGGDPLALAAPAWYADLARA